MKLFWWIFSLTLLLASCGGSGHEKDRLAMLDAQCGRALQDWQWQRLDSLAVIMDAEARQADDPGARARALYYRSAFRQGLSPREYDARQARLLEAVALAEKCGNDTTLSSIYNTIGIYELARNRRYSTAQYYFLKGADVARRAGATRQEIAASLNLSEVSRVLRDTLGLNNDLRLYTLARQHGVKSAVFASAMHLAEYYINSSMDSAKIARYIADMRAFPDLAWAANALEARYRMNTGDMPSALRLIEKANPDSNIYAADIYVHILSRLGRYQEANAWADRILTSSLSDDDLLDHGALLARKAANQRAMGDAEGAYASQVLATAWRDSVAASMKSDQINRFKVEYEVSQKDHRIQMQQASLRRAVTLGVAGCLFLLLVIAAILFYMHRRRAFYRTIVRQRLEAMEQKPEQPAPEAKTSMKSADFGPNDRLQELYARIRREVEERQAYRDTDITRETLAERLGTNRTYLTDAIKAATGMSYTQYMNSHRINEAVRVLSDPEDNTPLKVLAADLGFLTITTFYNAFRQVTGVSPAAFRRTARDLKSGPKA